MEDIKGKDRWIEEYLDFYKERKELIEYKLNNGEAVYLFLWENLMELKLSYERRKPKEEERYYEDSLP